MWEYAKPVKEDVRTLKEKMFNVPKKYSLIIRDFKKFGTSIEIAFEKSRFFDTSAIKKHYYEDDAQEYPFMEFFGMACFKFFSEYDGVVNPCYSVLYSAKGVSLYLEYDGNMTKYKTQKVILECIDKVLASDFVELAGKTLYNNNYFKKAITGNADEIRYNIERVKKEIITNGAYYVSLYAGLETYGKNAKDKLFRYDFKVIDVMEPGYLELNFLYGKDSDEDYDLTVAETVYDLLHKTDEKHGVALYIYNPDICEFWFSGKGDEKIDSLQIKFEIGYRYSKKITAFVLIKYINEIISSNFTQFDFDKEKTEFIKKNKKQIIDRLLTIKALLISPDLEYRYSHITNNNPIDDFDAML